MLKPGKGLTARWLTLGGLLLVSGCAAVSQPAVCDALTSGPVNDLNVALLADGGPQSMEAGATVVEIIDSGCGGK